MPPNNVGLRASAILCFVFADSGAVTAYPRLFNAIDGVRLVGADQVQPDGDAYATGKRLLAADDVAGALAAFQRALAAMPASPDALNGIGVSYDRLGRPDLARTFYEAGLALDPKSPPLLNNFGYSLYLQGEYSAALVPLRAAAASSDPVAAAAAASTLVVLIAQSWSGPAVPKKLVAPNIRIEVTNATEQRLVLGINDDDSNAASVSETLTDVVVAAEWTAADDMALRVQVRADEHAEKVALAATDSRRVESEARIEPIIAATDATELQAAAADTAMVAVSYNASRASVALVVGDGASTAVLARRRGTLPSRDIVLTDGGPNRRVTAAVFESDDAELNAFATRIRASVALTRMPFTGNQGRIAARFRT